MNKNEDIHDVIERAIENQSAFGDFLTTEEKQIFIDYGVVHSADEQEVLCRQGDNDRRVFIIIIGEVEISEGSGDDKVVLSHLKRGEVFGEIAALFEPVRISNVTVTKPSVFLVIPGEVFERVITGRSELYGEILERYKNRVSENALRGVDLFCQLDKDSLKPLIDAASIIGVSPDQVIINEGESGDYFYIMIRGTARVSHLVGSSNINLALIHPGDYFGEWSVLTGAPRAATVVAIDRVYLLRIERSVMLDFIQSQPEVAERIDLVAHNRHDRIPGSTSADSAEELSQWLQKLEDVVIKGLNE